ncbi:hypothetical protein [Streptomyces vastus]|uniref:Lipoprotein n=1 Tax=Streptomyces vastus TaxID=285451 RepID=A0ABN3S112_9ACTN
MRAICVASAALLGAGALALAAPAAVAATGGERGTASFGFDVSPTTVAAGGEVTLNVWGCATEAKVFSSAFDPVVIPKGQHSATATVGWQAEPGTVKVTFQCEGEYGNKDLTIEAGQQSGRGQSHMHAQKGVKAGAGGTIAGFDPGDIGLGLALVMGSVGAAYHWSHRRTAEEDN